MSSPSLPLACVIGGTETGVGKTSVAVGLMRALVDRGEVVQPFKIGPDFLDPTHHRAACNRTSHNLDGWMLDRSTNQRLVQRYASDASIALVEGVMGVFDGVDGRSESGSTAEMAKWLDLPVVLILDASAMGRSAAALVSGYAEFDPDLEITGVIVNRVGGEGHLEMLREAIESSTDLEVLGGIPSRDALAIPERHLGLHPASSAGIPEDILERWGEVVADALDLDRCIESCMAPPALPEHEGVSTASDTRDAPSSGAVTPPVGRRREASPVRLGVASDEAFCFYYHDNLARLEASGAELVYFSPLSGEWPDDLEGLYIGGGYPELHAEQLEAHAELRDRIRAFSEAGYPVYAECGGLMYLGESLETRAGHRHQMCGVFSFETRMRDRPRIDYVEVTPDSDHPLFVGGESARGHLFHQSELVESEELDGSYSYHVAPRRLDDFDEGYLQRRTLASYVHLHFGDRPGWVESWLEACRHLR